MPGPRQYLLFCTDMAFCHLSTAANLGTNHLAYLGEEKERQALSRAHLPFSLICLFKDMASI